jgi:hypothetical protein
MGFFYDSKPFLQTGDMLHMVGGNAPLIVDRETGEVAVTGTVYGRQHYIDEYVKQKSSQS